MRNFSRLLLSIKVGFWSAQKVFFGFTVVLVLCGCDNGNALDTTSEKVAIKQSSDMQEGVVAAIAATPYSALVQLKGFKRIALPNTSPPETRVEYRADVFETFRGIDHKQITFYQVIEDDEEPMLIGSQFIITLCQDNSGYFWPGTGSAFPNTPQMLDVAKSTAQAPVDNEIIDTYCF